MTATRILPHKNSSTPPQSDPHESARAVLAPGKMSVDHNQVDINLFHQSHGHLHEGLLRATAKQLGVTLVGKLHECKGCSMAKGLRKPIPTSTTTRAVKPFERVFMDVSGPKVTESAGGMKYSFLIRDDVSRKIWMYFGKQKSDTTRAFKQYLADVGVKCVPSVVETVRSAFSVGRGNFFLWGCGWILFSYAEKCNSLDDAGRVRSDGRRSEGCAFRKGGVEIHAAAEEGILYSSYGV